MPVSQIYVGQLLYSSCSAETLDHLVDIFNVAQLDTEKDLLGDDSVRITLDSLSTLIQSNHLFIATTNANISIHRRWPES